MSVNVIIIIPVHKGEYTKEITELENHHVWPPHCRQVLSVDILVDILLKDPLIITTSTHLLCNSLPMMCRQDLWLASNQQNTAEGAEQ